MDYAPAIDGMCCICDPSLRINANLCVRHKKAGKELSHRQGIRFIDAADQMYWAARDLRESYCLEHRCWHMDCPVEPHLDFSLVDRESAGLNLRVLEYSR